MKFNKTALGLAVALVVTPSWGHGNHGSNTVWKTTDGHNLVTTNGECVRAFDFASLGRDSCHEPEMPTEPKTTVEVPVETVKAIETVEAMDEVSDTVMEKIEPAAQPVLKVVSHDATINFATDSSELNMNARVALHKLVSASQGAEQFLAVQIVGHADSRGDAEYNLDLSQRRVDTIVAYLLARDIKTTSVFAQGEARPIMEEGVENLSASRRAQILIKTRVKTEG